MIKVRYIYSACIVTETPDLKILHDPWFTEGVYDGSWYQFPKIDNPLQSIGDVDAVYVSHIHPDHYDANFLKSYFDKFGPKQVLIANHKKNHLAGKMRADGINARVLNKPLLIGNTSIEILPHDTGSLNDIDSAILIKYREALKTHCVLNVNDINFDSSEHDGFLKQLASLAEKVDILLCGYTGAGPYPQTYYDLSDPALIQEAKRKKQLFLSRYETVVNAIGAKINIPFAGKYVLGGKLSSLNRFRGVADPVEVTAIDPKAVVLSDDGGEIDTCSLVPSSCREEVYCENVLAQRLSQISMERMAYENLMPMSEVSQLPLKRLLWIAVSNAIKKSECNRDFFYTIKIPDTTFAVINANNRLTEKSIYFVDDESQLPPTRTELYIDARYLFGLLTHIYHWNNAEVGSQYMVRRVNCSYDRQGKEFLYHLTV